MAKVLQGLALLTLICACSNSAEASFSSTDAREAKAAIGAPMPLLLPTHCGIQFVNFDSRWFETNPRNDGAGNPPPGWDNPAQAGIMTLVSDDEAIFTDESGHRLTFEARPPSAEAPGGCA